MIFFRNEKDLNFKFVYLVRVNEDELKVVLYWYLIGKMLFFEYCDNYNVYNMLIIFFLYLRLVFICK